jgi:hypothetical protein
MRIDLASGGRRTVPVTDDVLDAGLTLAASAVDAAVSAAVAGHAEAVTGPWCRGCPGHAECDPGGAWLLAHPRHLAYGA